MCGIAGLFGSSASDKLVKKMSDCLMHRGPDGSGAWVSEGIALGHRRLSIIDVENGAQPMVSKSGRWVVLFNGEIYNFKDLRSRHYANYAFGTQSDTEVIVAGLEQEGTDCFRRLNGMFAIAAWDMVEKRLVLARDPQGIKPLYFTILSDGTFAFASEIKALVASGLRRSVSRKGLGHFLDMRFVPAPGTIFSETFKLLPGHYAIVESDGQSPEQINFGFTAPNIDRSISVRSAQAKLLDEMVAAVQRQLISDVPIGILLSGGIDSAAVTAAAVQSKPGIATFCIGYDEVHWSNEFEEARRTADLLKTDHHEIRVSVQDAIRAMPQLLRYLEEPIVTMSVFSSFLLCREAAKHRKVVLTGQGADEPWAGYGRHRVAKVLPALRLLWPLVPKKLASLLLSIESVERIDEVCRAKEERAVWRAFHVLFPGSQRKAIHGKAEPAPSDCKLSCFQRYLPNNGNDFERLLAFETRTSLPENLLMLSDKLSMAHGLEVRVPLLDQEYIRFVESLPGWMRRKGMTGKQGKYLHKKACASLLPKEIVERPKKGFPAPVAVWLKRCLGDHLEKIVKRVDSFTKRFLDAETVKSMLRDHRQGISGNLERQLFAIWILEEWYRHVILIDDESDG